MMTGLDLVIGLEEGTIFLRRGPIDRLRRLEKISPCLPNPLTLPTSQISPLISPKANLKASLVLIRPNPSKSLRTVMTSRKALDMSSSQSLMG
jgi:hypothetical protein